MRFYRLFKKDAKLWSQLIVNSGSIRTSMRSVDPGGQGVEVYDTAVSVY